MTCQRYLEGCGTQHKGKAKRGQFSVPSGRKSRRQFSSVFVPSTHVRRSASMELHDRRELAPNFTECESPSSTNCHHKVDLPSHVPPPHPGRARLSPLFARRSPLSLSPLVFATSGSNAHHGALLAVSLYHCYTVSSVVISVVVAVKALTKVRLLCTITSGQ